MKSYKQISERVDFIRDWCKDHSHDDSHTTYIAVNVKIHQYVTSHSDLCDFLKERGYTPEKIEWVIENTSDEWMQDRFHWYIEGEIRYITEDFIAGCQISSEAYYNELIEKISKGEDTNYPHLEKKCSKEARIKEVQKWNKHDREKEFYLSLLDEKEIGLFGRSGGWFAICAYNEIEGMLEDVERHVEYKEKHEAIKCLKMAENFFKAVTWFYDYIKVCHAGIPEGWKDDLQYRVDELLEQEFCGEDCQIEKQLKAIAD